MFCCLFPHLHYPCLKQTNKQKCQFLNLLKSLFLDLSLHLIHPTLVDLFFSFFYFLYLLFPLLPPQLHHHHHLSLIFGLFKPMSSLPICRTVIPELHHSHRNFQDKSGKRLPNCRGWRLLEAELNQGSVSLTLLSSTLYCLVMSVWHGPHARMIRVLKRVPASRAYARTGLSPLKLFLSPGQAQQWTGVRAAQEAKQRESGHSVLARTLVLGFLELETWTCLEFF